MTPKNTFGARVIGQKEYDRALREESGGGSVFGVRVRGAIPETGPTNIAKRNTEHGPRVVDNVKAQDNHGKEGDGGTVSIDDLKDILAENPTFFDSLYEAELARDAGPRPDALRIFQEVERGIKGQGRQDVLDEIAQLLGEKRNIAAASANLAQAHREQIARMLKRQEENALLTDSDRLQALADRAEALDTIKESDSASSKEQVISANVETQIKQIADQKGLDVNVGPGEPGGTEPTKPDRHVAPESSGTGPRQGVPKGVGSEDEQGGGSSSDESDEEGETNYDEMSRAELDEEAQRLGVDADSIKGSGSGGRVVREDVLKAVKKAAKKQGK